MNSTKEFDDPTASANALLGLVIVEIAGLEEADRIETCKFAYRAFYLGSLGQNLADAAQAIEEGQ
jgi:hypothetical protein